MAVNAGFILQHKQVFPRLCFLSFYLFIVLSTYRFYSKAIFIRIFLFEIEG